MDDEKSNPPGEALLIRLRRLIARAGAAGTGNRRQLLALLDDIEGVRRGLVRESERIEDEMRRMSARATAIGAYLRTSQTRPVRRHN